MTEMAAPGSGSRRQCASNGSKYSSDSDAPPADSIFDSIEVSDDGRMWKADHDWFNDFHRPAFNRSAI
jgi:hypothetical protein